MFSKDVELSSEVPKAVLLEKHSNYLINYAKDDSNWEKIFAEYLKMSGIYWSLTAMDLMNNLDKIGRSSDRVVNRMLVIATRDSFIH